MAISKVGVQVGQVRTSKTINMQQYLINSVVFSLVGIVILIIAFVLVEWLTPKHSLRQEILEKQNMALAILCGFFMLAIAIIIASAIH